MIIRGGENIYPAEVEDALRSLPGVQDAAVFGLPSEAWGEEVAAAIVPAPADPATPPFDPANLSAALAGKLAHFKRPEHVHVVDALPLTASGKVQKFRLAERFQRG